MVDPTGHSMQGLSQELAKLKNQRYIAYQQKNRLRPLLRESYANKNYVMYDLYADSYLHYGIIVEKLNMQIAEKQREYDQFKDLQTKIDKKQYDKIDQNNYPGIPLFKKNISETGCGYIAAIIADSMLGGDVDVHDAYLYFNQPQNEIFGQSAISPFSIHRYLYDRGYEVNMFDPDPLPNSVYIACYHWANKEGENWHYIAYGTDENGRITPYNAVKKDVTSKNFSELWDNEDMTFLFGNTRYN